MSYDLLVFEPERAPAERAAFLRWWEETAEWGEDHGYDDPHVCTPQLRAWFIEMIASFPAMNGPYATEDPPQGDRAATDYSVGTTAIYAAFAWSMAEEAYPQVFNLAAKHRLGFFDVSADEMAVWLPNGNGGLELAHKREVSYRGG